VGSLIFTYVTSTEPNGGYDLASLTPEIIEETKPMFEIPTELVVQDKKGQLTTDSLAIAKAFGKEHKNVLQAIDRLDCSEEFRRLNFQRVEIIEKNAIGGKIRRPRYDMTFDGFTFVVMGFTGKRAAQYKEKYIEVFEAMREKLTAPAAPTTQLEALVDATNRLLEQEKRHRNF